MRLFKAISYLVLVVLVANMLPALSYAASPARVNLTGWSSPLSSVAIQQVANDPLFHSQWNLPKIRIPSAWDVTTGSRETIVAVIDTGINPNHTDLTGRMWTNPDEIEGNGLDDDNNGFIDDVHGYNFVANSANIADDHGHGTGVSSVIAANTSNGTGMSGIDWQAKVMPVKALDQIGGGDVANVRKAIMYAVDNGAHIINLSFGTPNGNVMLSDAVNYAVARNVTVVAATGNSGGSLLYPAAYSNVIAVGAINASEKRPSYASYGSELDVVAPGASIIMAGLTNNEFVQGDGTSFAAAHVSGILALIRAYRGGFSPAEAKDLLVTTAHFVNGQTVYNSEFGYGLVDAQAALNYRPGGSGNMSASRLELPADGMTETEVSVVVKDSRDFPKNAENISVRVSGENNIINGRLVPSGSMASIGLTDANGIIKFRLASVKAETKNITVINNTSSAFNGGTLSVRFTPFSANYKAQWLSQSPYPSIAVGQTVALSLRLKNVGNIAWVGQGGSADGQLRIGTDRPKDRISSFRSTGWLSSNRTGTMQQDIVRPGEVGEFIFTITATQGGKFREYFGPVAEMRSWLNDMGIYWDITVNGPGSTTPGANYAAELVDQGITESAGATKLWVELRNSGTKAWDPGTSTGQVRLGTAEPRDSKPAYATSSWFSPNRPANVTSVVNPGGTIKLEFTINKSLARGLRVSVQPVAELVTWFGPVVSWQF